MKRIGYFALVLLLTNISFSAYSAEGDTGWRNITGFGCHLNDGTCYMDIDGPAVGPAECLSNNVRFDVLGSMNGKTWLAMIKTAYLLGKEVRFNIKGCYSFQPLFPTFSWGRINK